MTTIGRIFLAFLATACISSPASGQAPTPQVPGPFSEIFTEKWPPSATQTFVTLTTANAVSEYLRATNNKLAEMAANALDKCLKSLACRAKVSAAALKRAYDLFNNSSLSPDQKASALIQAIEEDIVGSPSSPATGDLGVVASYAASLGITKLTWNRLTSVNQCRRDYWVCPNDGFRSTTFRYCYYQETHGGQTYQYTQPATYVPETDTVASESQYIIYRNNKELARFSEVRDVQRNYSGSYTIGGFLNLTLSTTLPVSTPEGKAGPFYDFDPQFAPLSGPLTYQVQATGSSCGIGYSNALFGSPGRFSTIVVDANGDGRPDFYPAADWFKKLPNVAGQLATQAVTSLLLDDDDAMPR